MRLFLAYIIYRLQAQERVLLMTKQISECEAYASHSLITLSLLGSDFSQQLKQANLSNHRVLFDYFDFFSVKIFYQFNFQFILFIHFNHREVIIAKGQVKVN